MIDIDRDSNVVMDSHKKKKKMRSFFIKILLYAYLFNFFNQFYSKCFNKKKKD